MSKIAFELASATEAEFYNIVDYYKEFDEALSRDFIEEFEITVQRLIQFPKAGHPYLHQTKRVFLDRFPYAIVYKLYEDGVIIVFAIMHMKRNPDYWEKRLK